MTCVLTFPRIFAPTGLLDAGPQTAAWLWVRWHAGFLAGVLAFALVSRLGSDVVLSPRRARRLATVVGIFAPSLAMAITLLATVGHRLLPALVHGTVFTPLFSLASPIGAVLVGLGILALAALVAGHRRHSVVETWLVVTALACLLDIAINLWVPIGAYSSGLPSPRRASARWWSRHRSAPALWDEHGTVEAVNQALADIYGYSVAELRGRPVGVLAAHERGAATLAGRTASMDDAPVASTGEVEVVGRHGATSTLLSTKILLAVGQGLPRHALFVGDITGRKRIEEELVRVAEHDALTGLPNRRLFNERMEKAVAALDAPLRIAGQVVAVDMSIGIALAPEQASDATTLLRFSDIAMYAVKAARTSFEVYRAERDQPNPTQLSLAAELRQAIAGGQLRLHFQPIVTCQDATVSRMEALVRWQHPAYGLLAPNRFIPLAEQMGLMTPLTLWALEEALDRCSDWHRHGMPLGVAVNISMATIEDPQFSDLVAALLRHDLPARSLTFELTESMLMARPLETSRVLTALRALGVSISMDDFGTGFSSLSYLSQLPIQEIKIDRSFIRKLATEEDQALVAFMLGLAGALGCDAIQGYHVGKPMPADAVVSWLRAGVGGIPEQQRAADQSMSPTAGISASPTPGQRAQHSRPRAAAAHKKAGWAQVAKRVRRSTPRTPHG